MKYPQYRKYPNNKNFFKIFSPEEFEEVIVMGDRYSLYTFNAKILPDRNFIHDMIFDLKNNWVEISETEYEQIKIKVT